jgi:flavin-dependent dehydrogenase
MKSFCLKFLGICLISSLTLNQAAALTLPAPKKVGTINIFYGPNGSETVDIGFISPTNDNGKVGTIISPTYDRIAFFSNNESHRLELFNNKPEASETVKFEFENFG